jgi:transposase
MVIKIKKRLGSHKPYRFVCGLDVHKHQIAAAIYGKDNSYMEFKKIAVFNTTNSGLNELWSFSKKYKPSAYVMEATGVYHQTISLFLQEKRKVCSQDFKIVIVNPADAAGIPQRQKHDRIDAFLLGKYYFHDLIKNTYRINPVIEDLKMLFRAVDKIKKERTRLKNRIIRTLDRAGFRPRNLNLNFDWISTLIFEYTKYKGTFGEFLEDYLNNNPLGKKNSYIVNKNIDMFADYMDIRLSSAQSCLVRQTLYELGLKTARISLMKIEIEKALNDQIMIRNMAYNLSTIPGISKYSAIWIIVETGGITNFSNIRKFLSYCGCAPQLKKSSEKVYYAHINKKSNKYLRTLFYNAAVVVCNLIKTETGLKSYARRIKFRNRGRGKLVYSKVASKIAKIAYAIMRDGVPFNPDLAQHKNAKHMTRSRVFQLIPQKEVRKCKRLLEKIRYLENLKSVDYDITGLVKELDVLLEKKGKEDRSK